MNYLLNAWDAASWVVIPITFLATIVLSLKGMIKVPEHGIVRFFAHEGWCISVVVFIPWHISSFARGDISPLPWKVFSDISAIRGFEHGVIAMLIVCIADMWLFWTPAQLYASRVHPSQRENVKFVRIINGLAGLLLVTPDNPFFKILQLI
ncbi:MAG: hypothetical protein JSW20_02180 [Nitrospiraceae bacterium]|nr:MAG: hypothetical protein JSW20_02180 [Nitrospiraceae bacterium]